MRVYVLSVSDEAIVAVSYDRARREFALIVESDPGNSQAPPVVAYYPDLAAVRLALPTNAELPSRIAEVLERDAGKPFWRPERVSWQGMTWRVRQSRTPDRGRISLVLVAAGDAARIEVTTDVPDIPLEDDEILMRAGVRELGVLAALVTVGVVLDSGRVVPHPSLRLRVCTVTVSNPAAATSTSDNDEPRP